MNSVKIRRTLTGSRIDIMRKLYQAIHETFEEHHTDSLDYNVVFQSVMRKTRGFINPSIVDRELRLI